ncbi:MAG: hypothetical protein OJF49_001893 [Ktedonobacterales bacterium]|nr:MAG: hypothetical protein OJF49_001893 [Ktedonobacterales bacterium]
MFVSENGRTQNDDAESDFSAYIPRVSSMQLHTFMLGRDVARRALLGICAPPLRTRGARKHAPKTIPCMG